MTVLILEATRFWNGNFISSSIEIKFNCISGNSNTTLLPVPCEKAKLALNRRIEGAPFARVENFLTDHMSSEEPDGHSDVAELYDECLIEQKEQVPTIFSWVNEIVKQAEDAVKGEDNGDRDNMLENKPFAKYFISLLQMVPIWSGISNKFFESPNLTGSSWSSETGFKNTKQLHEGKIPCSVDEFVKRDLEFNNSTVIMASQKYLAEPNTRSKSATRSKSTTRSASNSRSKSATRSTSNNRSTSTSRTENSANVVYLDSAPNDEDDLPQAAENFASQIDGSVASQIACPVCADGNMPDGAHKCFSCNKPVHVLDECSLSIGDEEGYGEMRQCVACFHSTSRNEAEAEAETETTHSLNQQEVWVRKRNIKSSKYLRNVPNWGVLPINKRVDIPLLINGSRSTNTYTINRKKINLGNTCAIDSVIQLITAAYAYHSAYRMSSINETDEICKIALMLANGYVFFRIFLTTNLKRTTRH